MLWCCYCNECRARNMHDGEWRKFTENSASVVWNYNERWMNIDDEIGCASHTPHTHTHTQWLECRCITTKAILSYMFCWYIFWLFSYVCFCVSVQWERRLWLTIAGVAALRAIMAATTPAVIAIILVGYCNFCTHSMSIVCLRQD